MSDDVSQPGATGAPPPAPANAAEARAMRNSLMADKDFSTKLFNGDLAAKTQWRELGEKISGPDTSAAIERAMSTAMPAGLIQDASDVTMRGYADVLRSSGLTEQQVRETLEDKPATQAEKDVAARWKQMNLGSKEFTARLMAGEPEAKLNWRAANIILNAPLREG
jgi:hypothetical protein